MPSARGDHSQSLIRTPQDMEASLASLTYSPSPRLRDPQELAIKEKPSGTSPVNRLHQSDASGLLDYSRGIPTHHAPSSPPPSPPQQQQQPLNTCHVSSSFFARRSLQAPAIVSLPSLKELPSLSPPLGCPRRRTSPDNGASSRTETSESESPLSGRETTHADPVERGYCVKTSDGPESSFLSASALRMLRNARLAKPTEGAGQEVNNATPQSILVPARTTAEQLRVTQDQAPSYAGSKPTGAGSNTTGVVSEPPRRFLSTSFFDPHTARNERRLGSSAVPETVLSPVKRNTDSVKSDTHSIGGAARLSPSLEPTVRSYTSWPSGDLPLLRDGRATVSATETTDSPIECPSNKGKKAERNGAVASSPTDSPLLVKTWKPDTTATDRDTTSYPTAEISQSRYVTSSPFSRRSWVPQTERPLTPPAGCSSLKRGHVQDLSPRREFLEAQHREERLDAQNHHPSRLNFSSSYSSASSSSCPSTASSSSSVSPNSSTASSRNQHSVPPTGAPLSPRFLEVELKQLEAQFKKQGQGALWDNVCNVLDRHREYIAFQGETVDKERARLRRLEADLAACAAVLQLRRRDAAYTPALARRLTSTSGRNDIAGTDTAASDVVFDPKSDAASLRAVAEQHVELFKESEHLLEKTREKLEGVEERLLETETDRDFLERECTSLKKQLAATQANEERAQVALREARFVALNDRQALEARHRDTVAELRDLLHQEAAKNENLEEQLNALTRGAQRERVCEDEVQDLLQKEKNLRQALQIQEEELARLREAQSQKETASFDEVEFWTEKAHHFETLLQSETERAKALEHALQAAHGQIRELEAELSDADLEVTRVEEAGKGKLLQVEMNLRTHVEDLEQQLEEEKKDREREAFGTRDVQVALEREIAALRSDCRKWQKLLRQKEAEIHVLKDNMNKNLEELHKQQEKVITEKLAEREAVLRSQLDSLVELRANDHFLVLRSKYEKHIAKLKQKVQTLLDQKASGKGKIKSLIQKEVSKAVAHSIGSLETSTRPVSGTQSLNPTTSSSGTLQFAQNFKEPDPQAFTGGCLEPYEPSRGEFVGASILVGTGSVTSTAKESSGTTVLGLTEENLERLERHFQNTECATSNFHATRTERPQVFSVTEKLPACSSAVDLTATPHRARRVSTNNTSSRSPAAPAGPVAFEYSVAVPRKPLHPSAVTPPRHQTQHITSAATTGVHFSVRGSLPGPNCTSHWAPIASNSLSAQPQKGSSVERHGPAAADAREGPEHWTVGFPAQPLAPQAGRLHRIKGACGVSISTADQQKQQPRTRSLAPPHSIQPAGDSPQHHFPPTQEAPGHRSSLSWGRQRVSRSSKI